MSYLVLEEWNYPTESGWDVLYNLDSYDEALSKCIGLAESEAGNYYANTKLAFDVRHNAEMAVVLPAESESSFFYSARVVPA